MEIRATGLTGPSAAISSIGGDGDDAFAAALGIFGANGLGSTAPKAVRTGVISSHASLLSGSSTLPAAGSAMESEPEHATSLFSGLSAIVETRTIASPLGQAAPFVQGGASFNASSGPAAGDVAGDMARAVTGQAVPPVAGQPALVVAGETEPALPQTTLPDQGSLLSTVVPGNATHADTPENSPSSQQAGVREKDKPQSIAPSASATPVSLPSMIAPETGHIANKDGSKIFGKPVVANDQPLPATVALSEIETARPAVPDQIVDAPNASSVEEIKMPPARPDLLDQQVPIAKDMLTDPRIAPVARSNGVAQAPITASAQPSPLQASKFVAAEAKEVGTTAATDAGEVSNVKSDMADKTTAEPFARVMQNTTPERAPLQPNAAPAPLPPAQPGGQAVAAPLAANGPMPAATVPLPPAPAPQGEVSPMVSFQADKVAREMGIQIARRVASGGDELVIRLDPAELGRIQIRMSVNEQGQLRAVVAADAPSVIEAIRNDISELSRSLEQAGVRTDGQSFRFDKGGNGDPGGQWQQRYQQQNPANRHGETSGHLVAEDETAYRPLAMNGRINMMA